MKLGRSVWLLALILLLGLSGHAKASGKSAPAALPLGSAMVVIAPEPMPADDQASEAYADWAGYLNDFADEKPKSLRVDRLPPAQWRALARDPAAHHDYATAFVRADGNALVYPGMILEPDVYRQGVAWLARPKPGPRPPNGFTATRVRPRR